MDLIHGPVPGYHIYLWCLAMVVSFAFHVRGSPVRDRGRMVELALINVVGIAGFAGIAGFLMHTAFADELAQSIGWPAGNPFQTEVAFANLGIGCIGYAVFWRRDFLLPAIVAKTIFLWGAAATHLRDIVGSANWSPNNAGPVLYWDLLLPVVMIALYRMHRRQTPAAPVAAAGSGL